MFKTLVLKFLRPGLDTQLNEEGEFKCGRTKCTTPGLEAEAVF